MRKLNILSILAVGLATAVLLLTLWGFRLSEQKNQYYQHNRNLSEQIKALDGFKQELKQEVDTLMTAYGQAIKENELLEKLLNNTKQKLTKTSSNFQHFRLESQSAVQSLKQSIQQLVKAKSTLEITLQEKTKTNDVLLEQAGIDRTTFKNIMNSSGNQELAFKALKKEFAVIREKRAKTGKKLLVKKTNQKPSVAAKPLLATDFRTEAEMKNGKLTAKAKRVRRIVVSFDLNEVNDSFLGEQELYLVIKDGHRKLLAEDAETVKVTIDGFLKEIRVVETKKVAIEKSQRIHFRFEVMDRLEEGYHRVEVYSKNGLLGETSFKVE